MSRMEFSQAEAAMRESEARYRSVFTTIGEGFALCEIITDASGNAVNYRILDVNPASERMVGFARDAVVGRTIRDIMPNIEEDYIQSCARAGLAGESVLVERHFESLNRWIQVHLTPAGDPGDGRFAAIYTDISTRKSAEEALARSEEQYRTLFESIDEGFCVIEMLFDANDLPADYRFLQINPAFERQTGLVDATGRTIREMVPNHEDHWFEIYGRIALTGEPARFENRAAALDRWYDVYAFRVGCPEERRVAVLFRDIIDRKRAEANLAFLAEVSQELARLTTIEETMGVLGARIGRHLNASCCAFSIIDETAATATIQYAWHREGVPNLSGVYRLDDYHGEELRRACRAGETYLVRDTSNDPRANATTFAALRIGSFVTVPLVRDGEWRFNLTVFDTAPRDWRGDEIELMRELTTRIWTRLERGRAEQSLRESEDKYRTLVENVLDHAIFLLDPGGMVTEWTTGAARTKGYAAEEVLGRHLSIFYTSEDVAAGVVDRVLEEAAKLGRAEREGWRVRKNGERFWVNEVLTAIRDANGALLGFTKISRDLTKRRLAEEASERVRVESERELLRRQLAAAEENERRRLARELHDQLGQELTAFRLGLEDAARLAGAADQTDPANHASSAASPLLERLAQLQTLALRMTASARSVALQLHPPELDDVGLESALDTYVREWSTRYGIAAEMTVTGIRGLPIRDDMGTALYRITQEALTNVAQHAHAREVSVLVELRDGEVRLIVEDDGCGFDVAVTAERVKTERRLGLAGMQERASLVGGTVLIESTPGGGTTLYVRLPADAGVPHSRA